MHVRIPRTGYLQVEFPEEVSVGHAMVIVKAGEIYGKRSASGLVMYNVLRVSKQSITLQNIDNLLSQFETTAEKLAQSGYERISATPYVDIAARAKKRKEARKVTRCPYTLDFIEQRADCEKPHAYETAEI